MSNVHKLTFLLFLCTTACSLHSYTKRLDVSLANNNNRTEPSKPNSDNTLGKALLSRIDAFANEHQMKAPEDNYDNRQIQQHSDTYRNYTGQARLEANLDQESQTFSVRLSSFDEDRIAPLMNELLQILKKDFANNKITFNPDDYWRMYSQHNHFTIGFDRDESIPWYSGMLREGEFDLAFKIIDETASRYHFQRGTSINENNEKLPSRCYSGGKLFGINPDGERATNFCTKARIGKLFEPVLNIDFHFWSYSPEGSKTAKIITQDIQNQLFKTFKNQSVRKDQLPY